MKTEPRSSRPFASGFGHSLRRLLEGAAAVIATTLLAVLPVHAATAEVLIVADEFPAMETLARVLRAHGAIASTIVDQDHLPPELGPFKAVFVYIHGELRPGPERTFIDYARAGGRLILLHHSISSGKRKNAHWFSFLGVALPAKPLEDGGYKWIEPATLQIVNLAPDHFVTANGVAWPERVPYRTAGDTQDLSRPSFTLQESEVYLNHVLSGPRVVLLGFKYAEPTSGKVYVQDTAGWARPAGKGWVLYFKPGHSARDFEIPTYQRILLNAVTWVP